ncbi:MAG: hypothetical protein H6739_09740 [Alphaproteobacteria bacterium]|nr:hypothetical protein [Alphaproteobacteria bacterium]
MSEPVVPQPTPEGLSALRFMVGRWRVEGVQHGAPVRGLTVVQPMLEGSFLVSRETLLQPDGGVDYEDLCLYCFNAAEADLEVHHFMAPGVHESHKVLPLEGGGGFHWVPRRSLATIVRIYTGQPWRVEVWHHDAPEPEVVLRYYPAS